MVKKLAKKKRVRLVGLSEATKLKRRVLVAEDVLSILNEYGRVKPESDNTYLGSWKRDVLKGRSDFQEVLPELMDSGCRVCGVGACFLGFVRLFDGVRVSEVQGGVSDVIKAKLSSCFSVEQLAMIEWAFESGDRPNLMSFVDDYLVLPSQPSYLRLVGDRLCGGVVVDHLVGLSLKVKLRRLACARAFGERFKTDRGRLGAILRNIVANGEFKPDALTR